MKFVQAEEVKTWNGRILDVRSEKEYAGKRLVRESLCVPLDRLMREAAQWDPNEPLVLICESGVRSADGVRRLNQAGFRDVATVQGGLRACKRAGVEIIVNRVQLPIIRQVLIVAGILVLSGLALSRLNPWFLLIDLLVGCGMVFSGITGICPMAYLLERMPWNRCGGCASGSLKEEVASYAA